MSIKHLTEQEIAMYAKGYVSIRIAVLKTKMHRATMHRLLADRKLASKEIASYRYISIASIQEHMGVDGVEMFKLDDWSDIFDESAASGT